MSFKFDSMIIILNKLNNGERVTVTSLMNDLEVSERTVHRYIDSLIVASFPISYNRENGSYVFDDGYSLNRPNISIEETLALALAKRVLKNFGTGIENGINSIEEKLSSSKADLPKHIILSANMPSPETGHFLHMIDQAIKGYKTIEITYNAVHAEEVSQRKVNPYYLWYQFHDTFWYLRGYCHLAKAERTFALDRIVSLKILDEHFLPKNIVPEDDLSSAFGAWLDGKPTEVVLIFDKEVKSQVLRKKWHQSQKEEQLKDGRLQITFTVKSLGAMKKWIYQWIPYVEVTAPKKLKKDMSNEILCFLHKNNTVKHQGGIA